MDKKTKIKKIKSAAGALLMDSSSSSSSEESDEYIYEEFQRHRRKHTKIENYVIDVVPKYDDKDFQSHFRLTKTAIEILLLELKINSLEISAGRSAVSMKNCILLTLWTMANQESFREIGDRFGYDRGHAHKVFMKTCKLLYQLVDKYIVWPRDEAELKRPNTAFNTLRGLKSFPGVVGCLDGTHISIPGPRCDNSYYNRKGVHSVILQGICNARMEFIDVFCGWPGSAHDARVWQNSPIYQRLKIEKIIPEDMHLLGDTAYPADVFLMAPFRDNGSLTIRQKKFNQILSSSRVVVEQAYGRLKGIFRRLRYLNVQNLKKVKYIVVSACILHNIYINQGVEEAEGDFEEDIPDGNISINPLEQSTTAGKSKRNLLVEVVNKL